jgi:glycosyltransferase involved in cell wall biosynthesis
MTIQRVAVVFDGRLRPDTTGGYVCRALQGLVDVVHFQPGQREEIPGTGFDLYLSVDDDTDHALPDRLRPLAYWAIDTHRNFDVRLERARRADFVFAAQRDGAEMLRRAGTATAMWLPLGCDPEVHRRHEVDKQYDVCIVGHVFPGPRAELLELLARRFPNHFIGQAFFNEMARIYSANRTVFNRSLLNDVNMRVFEVLACGSLLITNDLSENGLDELFRDGEHLVTYRSAEELIEKVAYYVEHEEERERIASAGRAEVIAKYTYRHRVERMLSEVSGRVCRAGEDPPSTTRASVRLRGLDAPYTNGTHRLASIIVPCFNQLEFMRHCLRALVRHTRGAWELVVIDNGSSVGTGAYLAGVQDAAGVPVTVISNDRNIGFPAAINQVLQAALGEVFVCS